MKNTMFFASYKDADGNEHANLYFDWSSFHSDTFSLECEIIQIIEGELYHIQNFFETMGKRYGLLREFRENCIC